MTPVSQRDFANALLHADLPVPEGLTTARGEADLARFAVYRNNVYVGLTRAIAARFPVVQRLVGEAFFLAMARAFAQDFKPDSPLMMAYGDGFPAFIAGFAPAKTIPYLPDVARVEAAWTRAYHAADQAVLGLPALVAAGEGLAGMRLAPHSSANLVQSPWPAGSIWAAHQAGVVTPIERWVPETVLVLRPDLVVTLHVVPSQDVAFVISLFSGESIGAAAEAAISTNPGFDFGTALVGLVSLGSFADLVQPEGAI